MQELLLLFMLGVFVGVFMCIRGIARSIIRWIRDIWMER